MLVGRTGEPPSIGGDHNPVMAGVRTSLRRSAPALLIFAAIRALGLVTLILWSHAKGKDPHQLLSARWDSLWYVRVAEHGYDFTLTAPDGRVLSDMAFFPLLPWLEQGVSAISPLGFADSGLLVSALASLFAAWAIFLIGDLLHGRRVGITLVALWGMLPVGIVQSMAYSESLFVALSAWSLYWVLRQRWVAAGILASPAGLTRPVGLAVVAALWVAAACQLARRNGDWRAAANRRMVIGAVLAPLGCAGYVVWVGLERGSLFGYLDVQAEWGNGFDGGVAFAGFILDRLTGPAFLAGAGLLIGVAVAAWAYYLCVKQRQPAALLVYCGIVVGLALCASGYFGSKPRLLMPAFPLLLPPAVWVARARVGVIVAVLSAVSVGSAVYGAFWLNGSGPP